MRRSVLLLAAITLAATACSAPGRPRPQQDAIIPPNKITDFNVLYGTNCAGCHGPDGKGGAAIGLANRVYLAIADDATIRRVTANGVPGTAMPAFAQSSGGMLTDQQIDAIVSGIRARWAKSNVVHDASPPSYAAQTPGDPKRGAQVYGVFCSSCHGSNGGGGQRASSIVDRSYLALVSDQYLRSFVIAGRPEMGQPDWRGYAPRTPMSEQDVSDVVAWLAAQRPQSPGESHLNTRRAVGGLQ